MAFHFQPSADLSDDEDNQIDLSAWQTTTTATRKSPPPAAAIAPTFNGNAEDEEEDDADAIDMSTWASPADGVVAGAVEDVDIDVEELVAAAPVTVEQGEDGEEDKSSRKRKRRSQSEVLLSSSFTSINKPIPDPTPEEENEEDETPAPTRTSRSPTRLRDTSGRRSGRLVPVVLLDSEPEDDEIMDFTAGNDVARRVMKEVTVGKGDVRYRVEFEDRHVEEVCYCSFLFPALSAILPAAVHMHCFAGIVCIGGASIMPSTPFFIYRICSQSDIWYLIGSGLHCITASYGNRFCLSPVLGVCRLNSFLFT